LVVGLLAASPARAGQPLVTVDDYVDLNEAEREAYVVGVYDGLMVAEQYYKGQELAWLRDCTAHGTSSEELYEIFEAYLPDHLDAALFGVAPAVVYAMADHCANAPQYLRDLAR
jgi:hypothetical protein